MSKTKKMSIAGFDLKEVEGRNTQLIETIKEKRQMNEEMRKKLRNNRLLSMKERVDKDKLIQL